MTKVIVDFDSPVYFAAFYGASEGEWEQGADDGAIKQWRKVRTFDPALAKAYVEAYVAPLREAYDEVVLAVSDPSHRYWRHEINPAYKGTRKSSERPVGLAFKDEWLDLPTVMWENHEADDVCASYMVNGYDCVSIDKDLLTVPGTVVTMRKADDGCDFDSSALPNFIIGSTKETTDEEAFWNFCWQCLVGDSCDNIPGCPGIGEKRANKLLDPLKGGTKTGMWSAVVDAYEGTTPKLPLLQQAACLRMRRSKDEPLWSPTMEGITYNV